MIAATDLVARALLGDRRALARTISLIENRDPAAANVGTEARAFARERHIAATVVGFTGPPGTGKSTLIARLAARLHTRGSSIAVLAVDPSSPVTGGAFLGDRIRMSTLPTTSESFYVRSIANRGHVGGVSRALDDVVALLTAAGWDTVLVETVGAGQDELDVRAVANTVVVIQVPGLGDQIQNDKAGILEIADILVVNKADLRGADTLRADLQAARSQASPDWHVPVIRVSALHDDGVGELAEAIDEHTAYRDRHGEPKTRRTVVRLRLAARLAEELCDRLLADRDVARRLEELADEVIAGRLGIEAATKHLLAEPGLLAS